MSAPRTGLDDGPLIGRKHAIKFEWTKYEPPKPVTCDLCQKAARWWHPRGGWRCGRCPRPE